MIDKSPIKPFVTYGRTGQRRQRGVFSEEFLPALSGRKRIEVFRQMSENDSVIGAVLFAIEMLIRQVRFFTAPASDSDADRNAAQFVEQCLHDMCFSWQDTLSDILSFLVYGWAYCEICYKRRLGPRDGADSSQFSDGLIGWQQLSLRSQDSLLRWEYSDDDRLLGLVQVCPPDFEERFIPITKAIHFVTRRRKANPEGLSILRNCYRDFFIKDKLQDVEAVGVERDTSGLPVLQPPEGVDLWADDENARHALQVAEELVKGVRNDTVEGVVIPYGWQFTLASTGSRRQFDVGSIIERYDRRIAMSVLADFIFLGNGPNGSFALSSDKTELFAVAIGTYLDVICDAFNTQAIPRLIALNEARFHGLTGMPRLIHSDIERPDLASMGQFIERMTNAGLLEPDEALKQYVRQLASAGGNTTT